MALSWRANDYQEFRGVPEPGKKPKDNPNSPEAGPQWENANAYYQERKAAWERWRNDNRFIEGELQPDDSGRSLEEMKADGMVGLYVDTDHILDALLDKHGSEHGFGELIESYRE